MSTNGNLLYGDECYALVGAAFEVYNELGSEFKEPIYQEAYEYELHLQKIPFVAQPELTVDYKGHLLTKKYKPDLIARQKIIVELKVLPELTPREDSQVLNYLRASDLRLGLLINFGHPGKLEWKRIIR